MVSKAIEISNGCFGYVKNNKPIEILSDINFSCLAGDFIGVAGLNGSGKSTLLRSLCGLLPVLKGNVLINEKLTAQISHAELAKQISIVLTEKIGGFNLTAYDAVSSGQIPYTNLFNKLEKVHLDIIDKAILTAGIHEYKNKLLTELSDGLFQKTMIAKCIAQQTPIMLLDEPSAFLDYASKHELFKMLQKLTEEEQKCILVSSHDLDLILKYCTKVLLVKNGKIEMMNVTEARGHKIFTELTGGYL